jgi:phi13 family phage major tail protein
MAVIGLKSLHYAVITNESETETTYGPVKRLGPATAFNMAPTINRASQRADDKVIYSATSKGPTEITLNTTDIPKEVEAELLGKTVHPNGLLSDNANDQAPYVAIGGMAENAKGGYDYFWIYRVQFAPAEQNMETKQETPTYQLNNLTGQSLPRLHDDEEKTRLYDGDETVTDKSIFDDWFKKVIDKDWAPAV